MSRPRSPSRSSSRSRTCRGWSSSSRRPPTRCPWSSPSSRSGPTSRRRSRPSNQQLGAADPARGRRAAGHRAQHQRPAGHRRHASARPKGADQVEAARIAREVVLPEVRSLEGVSLGGPDRRRDAAILESRSTRPDGRGRHLAPAGHRASSRPTRSTSRPGTVVDGDGSGCRSRTEHRFTSVGVELTGVRSLAGRASSASAGPTARRTPVTLGEIATVDGRDVQASGYARTNGAAIAHAHRLQGVRREHGRGRRRGPGRRSTTSRRATRASSASTPSRTCRCSSRSRATAWSGRACWAPLFAVLDHLPVPAQPALDAGRRDQHPAVDLHRAGASWASPA